MRMIHYLLENSGLVKAKELGLIDDIGDIYSILHSKYGKNIDIRFIQENRGLLSSLKSYLGFDAMFKSILDAAIQTIISAATYSRFGLGA